MAVHGASHNSRIDVTHRCLLCLSVYMDDVHVPLIRSTNNACDGAALPHASVRWLFALVSGFVTQRIHEQNVNINSGHVMQEL